MPEILTRDEQWAKLKTWLSESIAAIDLGDVDRLPESFVGERAEGAREAYETCKQAMKFLEAWDIYGLPRRE